MHDVTFLQDMAVVMVISAIVTVLFRQFRLPVVLGYIMAGIIIGPHTPPYSLVTNVHSIQTLSELGVIFLLFGIGLEFSLSKLLKVGMVSFAAATMEIFLMFWIGFSVGKAFAWSFMDSLFLGAILSISSTTIIAKILMDTKKLQEKFAQIILGILVIEDILAIVIIAILSGLASTGEFTFTSALTDLLKVGAFISGILFFGALIVPRLIRYIYSFENSEMMIIAVLGLCFGVSLIAAKLGFSVALGAFLIGAVIAETQQSKFIIRHFESIRDMFTAVFFVSVGMLFDPHIVVRFAVPIVIITFVTIIGKVFSCSFAAFLTGNSPTTSLRVGLGLAQIGEFSFIIAQMGESSQATSSFIFPLAVAVSSFTTLSTPFLMKYAEPITQFVFKCMPKPIVTFAGLYSGWIDKIHLAQGERSRKKIFMDNLSVYLPRIIFYLLSMFGALRIAPEVFKNFKIPEDIGQIILAVVMFPFLLGLLYTVDAILWQTFMVPFMSQKHSLDGREAQKALHHVLRFAVVVVAGLIMLTLTPIFMHMIPVGFIVLGIVLLSALVLWGSMRKIHEKIEKTVLNFFEQDTLSEAQAEQTHDELVRLIQKDYPWGVETQDFMVPLQESGINCPIKNLGLREHTGVTIVAIYRDENAIINPAADAVIAPGDVILLMGNKEQLHAAVQFLHTKIKGDH
jgi:CPA2 family monovalent cation:H+ antiporter-2